MARDGVDAAPRDLLTALLTARDPATGENLTRDDVNLTLTEMMVAGHDTTAATVACMMALLASHPEVKATVTAGISVLSANNGAPPDWRFDKDVAVGDQDAVHKPAIARRVLDIHRSHAGVVQAEMVSECEHFE